MRAAIWVFSLAAGLIALAGCGGGASQPPSVAAAAPALRFPHPNRVAVVVLENRSYEQVIGSRSAPYLNGLARRFALATHFYAITHPSLPNYIALTGGSVYGIKQDCASCDAPGTNVVGQLDRAGISWKAYFEGLDDNSSPGPTTQDYNPHYNPFVYYESVRGTQRDRARVVGFDALRSDLKGARLPRFSWIAPGVLHDGHNGTLLEADRYASQLVPKLLRALGPDGILYLTWDEGAPDDWRGVSGQRGGGRIALIAAGGGARRHARMAIPANDYALLRMIEANFGLRTLGQAGAQSTPLLRPLLRSRRAYRHPLPRQAEGGGSIDRPTRTGVGSKSQRIGRERRMTRVLGQLCDRWASARDRSKSKRRERALDHVSARADKDRYNPHKYEGPGSGGGTGSG
jgi:phosphatidylinositol-3-phosphatase